MITGTILNTLTILVGALIGTFFRWLTNRFSDIFPKNGEVLETRLETIIMQGVSLCVLLIGISGSLKGQNTLVTILSIVIGAVIGELLDLDLRIHILGDWLQSKTDRLLKPESNDVSISEGFVTATLLFCVGAMAIVGSLENGLTGNYDTLMAKALLDGISSIVFASSLGIGVAFSAVAIFLYQGSISLMASFLQPLLSDTVIAEMTCVGSLLIIALALNMLGMTKIKVMNLVPAIFLPIVMYMFI
jgi:uncharacterized membrane protein YqgA involved in biofilm formation